MFIDTHKKKNPTKREKETRLGGGEAVLLMAKAHSCTQ